MRKSKRFYTGISAFLIAGSLFADSGFSLAANGVTILCPGIPVGSIGTVGGVTYTKIDSYYDIHEVDPGDAGGLDVPAVQTCTSDVTTMHKWFDHEDTFDEDIGHWDTSKVTDMSQMFFYASSFNKDIGNWDVSRVVI